MYDRSDPRSSIGKSEDAPKKEVLDVADVEYGLFYKDPPTESNAGGRTWFCRGQNFIVAYSDLNPGAVLERTDQIDEFMVIAPRPDTPIVASAGAQQERTEGFALLIMPPGPSRLEFPKGGRIIRLFSTQSADLNAKCANAASFAKAHPNIPAFKPWPAPPAGYKIRVYSLEVPFKPGRFGRLFRCTTLMANVLAVHTGTRDPSKVSPHHHDDFEQGSFAIEGRWRHHVRWPWTTNMNTWREDVHTEIEAPSIIVIPPPTVHTSTWHAPENNQLIDIFSPPRLDFSEKPDWVLNADDYPMPRAR